MPLMSLQIKRNHTDSLELCPGYIALCRIQGGGIPMSCIKEYATHLYCCEKLILAGKSARCKD